MHRSHRRLLTAGLALTAAAAATAPGSARAAAFTPGDLVIYRVGDGSAALTNAATAVFLDEYNPAGTLVQSIAMPTASVTGVNPLTASGTATSEGLLNLSANGTVLTLTGYAAAPGTASVATTINTTANPAVPRVIGVVDAAGGVNTTTALTNAYSGNNIRSAVSIDGNTLYATGGTAPGLLSTTAGNTGTNFTQVSTTSTNLRDVSIQAGQLYVSTGAGALRIATVGTGTPTTSGQTITNLPGFPTTGSPYQFVFADLSSTVAGVDTLYVADDSTTGGGLQKYSLVGGNWTLNNTITIATLRGLTGFTLGSTETLYGTNGTSLVSFTDATGYNVNLTGAATVLATAATNEAFRGVAFAPTAVPEPSTYALIGGSLGLLLFGQGVRRRRSSAARPASI